MRAATQYWQGTASKAIALDEGEGYGEEIARLVAADAECNEAFKVVAQNKMPWSLYQLAQALQRRVPKHFDVAKYNNASVYLEDVPKFSELQAVEKAAMVRPFTLHELQQELIDVDLFKQFVPKELLIRAGDVKQGIKVIMDRTANKIFWSNEVVEKTLHSMGLPASIEAFEKTSDNGIPRTIWRRIHLVKVIAGSTRTEIGESRDNPIVAFIQHQIQENQRMLDDGEKKLYLIKSRLSQEQAEDDVCRQNYGEKKWARPLSSSFNRKFRADMYRCFSLVREAKTSDRTARDKLNENQDKLEALSRDKASLDHELPELQQNNFSCKEEIACVSSLFSQLERHMQEKHHVLYDFRQSYNNFDALPELLSGKNAGAVFTDTAFEIEKQSLCDEFERRISSICKLERYMLKEIIKANARFEAKKEISHVLRERQTLLQYLNDGADVFEQLHSHVEEKTKFYDELSIRIAQLHQTVEDHCSAREFEKRELEMNLAADEEMRQHETEDAALARR